MTQTQPASVPIAINPGRASVAGDAFEIGILLQSIRRLRTRGSFDWATIVELGLPLLCTADTGGLEQALAVLRELGRAGSDLPLAERIALNLFAPGLVAQDARVALVAATGQAPGISRCDGMVTGRARVVAGAEAAECFIVIASDGTLAAIDRKACQSVEPTPGLADGLCDVQFDRSLVTAALELGDLAADFMQVVGLGLAARAQGAALEGFEAVCSYATTRRQFGQAIGSFQAIQHKLANSHIALSASSLLLDNAARGFDRRAANWQASANAAIAFSSVALRRVALETQHAYGAIGFAEDHDAPRLFRCVHGDVTRFGAARHAQQELGAFLLEQGPTALAALLADDDDRAAGFRLKLRNWLATNWTDENRATLTGRPFVERDWDLAFLARLGRAGWTTLNWPHAEGGMAATPLEQLAFTEELQKAGAPEHAMICPCRIMAPEIIAHGNDALRRELLPRLMAGEVTACLGYSEPEAGSDLVNLRTRATRDGDDYVIDGSKIWTTDGHRASHMILAARTEFDRNNPRDGITLFILPMNLAGITIRPMTGLHGHIFCEIFFERVCLPARYRLGDEGTGWSILSNALANERITMGGLVSRLAVLLGEVIDTLGAEPALRSDGAVVRSVGSLAASLLAGRLLSLDSIEQASEGSGSLVKAAMAKVYASEFAQALCEEALDLFGSSALLGSGASGAPAQGLVEEMLRLSIMYVVGGGSNEIQRSLIARRGLNLGRS